MSANSRGFGWSLFVLCLLAFPFTAWGQDLKRPALPGAGGDGAQDGEPDQKRVDGWKRSNERLYLGRPIARTMHWRGAEWLTRESREREERTQLLLDNLGIEPGQVIGDLGCGNGYLSLPMAARTGEGGRVLAADLQPEMLALLEKRAAAEGIENIQTLVSTGSEPGFPPASCDLILLVDVYHELDDPEGVLAGIRRALAPGGRLALVEFRSEDASVPIKPEHKMTKAQMLGELAFNGLRFSSEFNGLPWQHLVFFEAVSDPRDVVPTLAQRSTAAAEAVARGAARAWLADDGPTLRGFLGRHCAGRGAWVGRIDARFDPLTFGGEGWRLESAVSIARPGPTTWRLWCSAPAGDLVGRLSEREPGLWRFDNIGFVPVLRR